MKIAVSACLLGVNCKYSGGNNYSEKVARFIEGHEVISVCPEMMGGLPTPRTPAEIVNGVVTMRDGTDVDKEFRSGAKVALEKCLENRVDLLILQSRSPSCGVNEIYDGTFTGQKIQGRGIFAKLAIEAGIKTLDLEDL